MIATDNNRCLQLAARHHLVECEAKPVTIAKADPADPRRQSLELDPCSRHVEPIVEMLVVRHQLLHLGVGAVDILRISRERRPAEWTDAPAEQRTDVGWDETGE